MTTKTYENMTVTVSCKETEDIEMMELIKKMNDTKVLRERAEEFYLPRIKAIGAAKWAEICNQLLGLCKMAEEVGIRRGINSVTKAVFHRDDDGERYSLYIEYSSNSHAYILNYGYTGHVYENITLNPDEKYYKPELGEDKDGWLVKWDEYDIYTQFRKSLMDEIHRRIIVDEGRIRSIRENYDEIAGK